MTTTLRVAALEVAYGGIRAVKGIDLEVREGELVTLIGANGAGKTTTLRAISGTVRRSGEVLLGGEALGRTPEAVARRRVAHVPEGRGTFVELTVEENLRLGAYARRDRLVAADLERVLGWFPRLRERLGQQAGTLSGGEQQMLALGRALMLSPRLLLLDEPSLGLAPLVVAELFGIVRRLNEEDGLAVLVVEQNASLALAAARRAYVLEAGRVAVEGPSAELREHADVRRSYLGY